MKEKFEIPMFEIICINEDVICSSSSCGTGGAESGAIPG